MIAMALLGMLTYSGSKLAAGAGYLLAVLAASVFAPAAGALTNELFPTSVRASVAGWEIAAGVFGATAGLLAFGAVADVGNRFGLAARRGLRGHDPGGGPVRAASRDARQGAGGPLVHGELTAPG